MAGEQPRCGQWLGAESLTALSVDCIRCNCGLASRPHRSWTLSASGLPTACPAIPCPGAARPAPQVRWEGEGVDEVGWDADEPGRALVRIDPKYYRPTEVELLIGKKGWKGTSDVCTGGKWSESFGLGVWPVRRNRLRERMLCLQAASQH